MFSTTSSQDVKLCVVGVVGEWFDYFHVLRCFACFKYFFKLNNLFPGKIKTTVKTNFVVTETRCRQPLILCFVSERLALPVNLLKFKYVRI